ISLATVSEEFSKIELLSPSPQEEDPQKPSKSLPVLEAFPEPQDSPDFPDFVPTSKNKIAGTSLNQSTTSPKAPKAASASVIHQLKNNSEKKPKKKPIQENNLAEKEELVTNEEEIDRIRQEKQKQWERLQIRQSTSTFRPLASEYAAEIKIVKDPTGKLYTDGKLQEFIDLQVDKFTQLKKILKARPEGHDLLDISLINRLENSVEVKFVGMLKEKSQTSKKNYILTFEDQTGNCKALIRPEPFELYNLVNHLLPDQVVIVEGYLNIPEGSKSGIIFANNLIFPDAPNNRRKNFPEEDLAICFISDTHFGSKDWLGNVWHRFVEYLKGNIGTDRQIKQAGKVKYICVAGDLVDGIGIFPNQDKRLSITDIYQQYDACADYFAEIPEHIKIIISPGDHDAVRKALPTPAIPKDIAKKLYDIGTVMVGCPALVNLHGVAVQMFHGTSLIDLNMS
ncbi:MAG: metallophosphoesterase, partial [Candidatus Heimdallarchaeota archaeon]|nr:metallophosphoesterase [Candidatus Heimdallarchaeota archaeon]